MTESLRPWISRYLKNIMEQYTIPPKFTEWETKEKSMQILEVSQSKKKKNPIDMPCSL